VSCPALRRGRLDAAEALAASVRRGEGISQIGRTHSGIVLAPFHIRAGEPGGLRLAHDAITAVIKISKDETSFGSTAVQIRRGAEVLSDPENLS
jgi:hypothetical protein